MDKIKKLLLILLPITLITLCGCMRIGDYIDCNYHGSGTITYISEGVVVWSGTIISGYDNYEEGTFTYKQGKGVEYLFMCDNSDKQLVKDFLCEAKGDCE